MSDDTQAGYITLEGDDDAPDAPIAEPPNAEAAPDPEPPAADAEAAAAPEGDDDDADPTDTVSDATGRTYVPLSHLQREREARKALKEQLRQPRSLSPEEQRQLESARYIADQLRGRPDIIEALQTGQPLTREQQRTVDRAEAAVTQAPITPVAEFTPDELREVAELQGYYGPDGAPDLKAAERYLGILDRRAAKLADQRVAPLLQREVNSASERQIEQIAQMAPEMGISAEEARPILRELAKANPAMMAETPEYALAGVIFAAGMKAIQERNQRQVVPPAADRRTEPPPAKPEPLLVERSVGPAKTPALSSADRARAQQYGINPKALEHAAALIQQADGGTITFGED